MEVINEFIDEYITIFENNNININDVEDIVEKIKIINNTTNYNNYDLMEASETIESREGKYLLQGMIYEVDTETRDAISYYKKAKRCGSIIALWQLARLYETGGYIIQDKMKAFKFYYRYYEKIGDLESFMEDSNLLKNAEFIKILIQPKIEEIELEEKNKKLKKTVRKLKRKIVKLKYAPNGIGYHKSKNDFEILCNKQKK